MQLVSPVALESGTVLFEPGQVVEHVDFPRDCVESLVTLLGDGRIVEVASVGSAGIAGVPMVLGGSLAVRAVCSVAGTADRMDSATFVHEVETDVYLRGIVDDCNQALLNQLAKAVACNRLHSTTERLARWLLTSSDHTGADGSTITLGFLGQLLGSSETTVGACARTLEVGGLISRHRGRIVILDRAGLRMAACECYGLIKREVDGVLQKALVRSLVLMDS